MTPRVARWLRIQNALAAGRRERALAIVPRFVAGVDCAIAPGRESIVACAVVWDRNRGCVVEIANARRKLTVPYVPGYLSFREGPAVIAAVSRLRHPFGAVLFDGQGIAHPRRCGLATHMGVTMDVVSAGVAKSRFIGEFTEPAGRCGAWSRLLDGTETIGAVLRTRGGAKPVFVSVGHRIDLPSAIRLVRACVRDSRIPEPTRIADREVARLRLL